jgi:hypothetical protein
MAKCGGVTQPHRSAASSEPRTGFKMMAGFWMQLCRPVDGATRRTDASGLYNL